MVLLHFARWLRVHRPEMRIDVLALMGGALENDLRQVADRYVDLTVPPIVKRSIPVRAIHKAQRMLGFRRTPTAAEVKEGILRSLAGSGIDAIHANSLASIPVGARIKELAGGGPFLIAHVHELELALRQYLPNFSSYMPVIDHILAASELVRANLIEQWAVPPERVEVQYEFTSIAEKGTRHRDPGQVFRVGASGTVNLRKGYDVFIQVARWVRDNSPETRMEFTWVGRAGKLEQNLIALDLKKSGLLGMVHFVGEMEDPSASFNAFDVFLLTSREDPFPLVAIEMGLLGKPMICFEGATGTLEVLRDGGGRIVPYLNVEAMGRALVDYFNGGDMRQADGATSRVLFARFTPDVQCPLMIDRIDRAMARKQFRA